MIFLGAKRYNRYAVKPRRSVHAKAAASRRIVVHQSLMHSAPTGTDTGADTIGERIGTAHQPGADTQAFLGGRTGETEARRDHTAG